MSINVSKEKRNSLIKKIKDIYIYIYLKFSFEVQHFRVY